MFFQISVTYFCDSSNFFKKKGLCGSSALTSLNCLRYL